MRAPKLWMDEIYILPNFCKSRSILEVQFRLFNSPNSRYDVITGRDVLKHGFVLNHARNTVTWDGLTISMTVATQTPSSITTSFTSAQAAIEVYTNSVTTILHAKYYKFSPQEVVDKCVHLAADNKAILLRLLSKFSCLFSGSLGCYVHKKSPFN